MCADLNVISSICTVGQDTVYLGIQGASDFSLFDFVGYMHIGGYCEEPRSYATVDDTASATQLTLEHFTHGSCSPGGFTGYAP